MNTDRVTMFIRSVPADVALAFKMGALAAGKSHGEWLTELVTAREGGEK